MTNHDPNNVVIASYLEDREKPNVVSWIILGDHFKAHELAQEGLQLVKPSNANKYCWVVVEVLGTSSTLNTITVITNVGITFAFFLLISRWL